MNEQQPELPWPVVAFDAKLGEQYEWIDLDLPAIAEMMREEGISDKNIAKTFIHIDSQEVREERVTRSSPHTTVTNFYTVYGRFSSPTRTEIYMGSIWYSPAVQQAALNGDVEQIEDELEKETFQVIEHEIAHRIHYLKLKGVGFDILCVFPSKQAAASGFSLSAIVAGGMAAIDETVEPFYLKMPLILLFGALGFAALTKVIQKNDYKYSYQSRLEKYARAMEGQREDLIELRLRKRDWNGKSTD